MIAFPNEQKAKQGRKQLLSMEKQDLIMMEDAVVVVKKADGAITLNQLLQPSASGKLELQQVVTPLLPAQAL